MSRRFIPNHLRRNIQESNMISTSSLENQEIRSTPQRNVFTRRVTENINEQMRTLEIT